MLNFDDGASIDLTIGGGYEPPRPNIYPFPRRGSRARTQDAAGATSEAVVSLGADVTRLVRFVSSETQGVLTIAEVNELLALYVSGAVFTLNTDLLVPLGEASVAYTAYFDPTSPPQFPPFDPGGKYYYLDLPLYVKEV